MKEKIRVGFEGDFQFREIEIAAGDPAPWDPSQKFSIVGTRQPRLDGKAKTTGEAKYSIDVRLPGMLYGRILRCPLPAATVKSLDLSAARKMPGVRAALALAEPGEKLGWENDERVLTNTWPRLNRRRGNTGIAMNGSPRAQPAT